MAVLRNTRGGYEIVQRAIVIAILFQVCLFLWAMAGIYGVDMNIDMWMSITMGMIV